MTTASGYQDFISTKLQYGARAGFEPLWMPDFLFDFQRALVEWAIQTGRAAIFADCGLGKTPMQLVWAENVIRKTNKPVLILTPLSVTGQTLAEAQKFGIEAERAEAGNTAKRIHVTNYERLHYLDTSVFAGVVCDESSILKSFDGVRRGEITEFMRRIPYRLLCTATAAPNDYIELGTSSEALGYLGHMDMLQRFFKSDQNTIAPRQGGRWRHSATSDGKFHIKPHAEQPFWRWVCSWARAVRKPSDLGFDDGQFILPPLVESDTIIKARKPREGMLFDVPAVRFDEERELTRRTIAERCEEAACKAMEHDVSLIWCHLNDEGDYLEKIVTDSMQVKGSDSDEHKEAAVKWFTTGTGPRRLISKPKMFGFGLNFQHCAHMTYFPTHSYEQYYQAVRRCWRFGQTESVTLDNIGTDGDARVIENLNRKAIAADSMFADLVLHMNDALHIQSNHTNGKGIEIPTWLQNKS